MGFVNSNNFKNKNISYFLHSMTFLYPDYMPKQNIKLFSLQNNFSLLIKKAPWEVYKDCFTLGVLVRMICCEATITSYKREEINLVQRTHFSISTENVVI